MVVYSLVAGYCLLNPTLGWVNSVIVSPYEKSNIINAINHLVALALGLAILGYVVKRLDRKDLLILESELEETRSNA